VSAVFATDSLVLITPIVGTPSSDQLINCTSWLGVEADVSGTGIMLLGAPVQSRKRAMSCASCGAPLGALSLCNYCKRDNA